METGLSVLTISKVSRQPFCPARERNVTQGMLPAVGKVVGTLDRMGQGRTPGHRLGRGLFSQLLSQPTPCFSLLHPSGCLALPSRACLGPLTPAFLPPPGRPGVVLHSWWQSWARAAPFIKLLPWFPVALASLSDGRRQPVGARGAAGVCQARCE